MREPAVARGELAFARKSRPFVPSRLNFPNLASPFRALPQDRPALGLAAAAGLFLLASGLHWLSGGISDGCRPMAFLPAILIAGLVGGIGIGLLVAALCTLLAWLLFLAPDRAFPSATPDLITLGTCIVAAGLQLYIMRMLKLAVADLSRAQERSNLLFRELQHRVANNLQFIAAVLVRRRKELKGDNHASEALGAAQARLETMARVHRRLHDPRSVDQPFQDYLRSLCGDLIEGSDTPELRLEVESPPLNLSLNALMSVSLIVAELITNSLKHAFHGRSDGSILVRVTGGNGTYRLTVADDGPGLPSSFGSKEGDRLGQDILQSLAAHLRGTLTYRPGPGAVATLVFRA